MELTQELLQSLFTYDKDTGELRFKYARGCRKANSLAGTFHDGYLRTKINKNNYMVHRLIWFMNYGFIDAKKHIDHINHNKLDNRLINLRLVEENINHKNKPMQKNNTSGYCGVYFNKKSNAWFTSIPLNGKNKYLGAFKDKEDAIKCRKEAEIKYNYHPNHGKTL